MSPPQLDRDAIDGFLLEEVLGEGGMGVVYRARDVELDRVVAIKVLFDLTEEENLARFQREARALARLTHPNIVHIYSQGKVLEHPYFVMEFVDGPSLMEVLEQRGALVVEEAIAYAIQAAKGLDAAATAGVIHRDVKPHNLLLQEEGTLKIVDFGLARIGPKPSPCTSAGVAMGTPHYMAPEQARAEEIDHRSDQYALGATLFHMLSGRPPFLADNDMALLLMHQQEAPPSLSSLVPDISSTIEAVVARTLAKTPEARFADYSELIEALYDSVDASTDRMRWSYWAGGIIAASLGVVAGAALLWWPGKTTDRPANPSQPVVSSLSPVDAHAFAAADAARVAELSAAQLSSREDGGGEDRAPDPLAVTLARLMNSPKHLRAESLVSLPEFRDPRAVDLLCEAVQQGRGRNDELAVQLLGRIGDQRAVHTLLGALRSSRREVVLAAIDALERLRDIEAVAPLRLLEREHPDAEVRERAGVARRTLFSVESESDGHE